MGVKLKNGTGSVKTEGVGVNRVNRCCRDRLGVEREETLGDESWLVYRLPWLTKGQWEDS